MTTKYIFQWRKLSLIGILPIALICSCTSQFADFNTNKHEATEEQMGADNLKTGAFFAQMQRNVVLFEDGTNLASDYQVAQNLSADIFSGFYAPTGAWYGGNHNGAYSFIQGWVNALFNKEFSSVMPAWLAIHKVSIEQNTPWVDALATVIKVQAMHRVADTYGPIPYVDFGNGQLKLSYNSLEEVYVKFFNELDASIDVLSAYVAANPSGKLLEKYDYVYGGQVSQWLKFANTLRLRLAMRIAFVNPTLAQTQAEKSINNVYGLVEQPSDIAMLQRSSNLQYTNPLYTIAYEFNNGEIRMGATMDCLLNGYNDPRAKVYFNTAKTIQKTGNNTNTRPNANFLFCGVRQGMITTTWPIFQGDFISNLNVTRSTPIVWMNASESYFLRAEGALRGWNMGGADKDFYEAGVKISFVENGLSLSDATTYLAGTSNPINFVDNALAGSITAGYTYPTNVGGVVWSDAASKDVKFEKIITQKRSKIIYKILRQ